MLHLVSSEEQIEAWGGTDLLDAGLRAIVRGWKIFPCNGKKRPLTPNGFYDATDDPEQVRNWVTAGLVMWGRALTKDDLVIDLDTKQGKNGIREFEELQGYHPEQFEAPRVRTGTGGKHIYTDPTGRNYKNSIDEIAKGVDTKTVGGYVIIPSGDGFYCWETSHDTPKPPTPTWADAALQKQGTRTKGGGSQAGVGKEYIKAALAAFSSDDYEVWYQVAGALHHELGEDGYELFKEWSAKSSKHDAEECDAKWDEAKNITDFTIASVFYFANEADPEWRDKFLQEHGIKVEVGVRKETADAVEQALVNADCGLFVRGGLIVRIDYLKMKTWDEKDVETQAIVECGDAFITETVASTSLFIKYNEKKHKDIRCNPPNWIASTLRQRMSRLTLPVLNGVSNCPIMRFNGELITEPGYHKETGLYFDPRGAVFPAIAAEPTKDDAQRALDRLKVLFHTFPFVNNSSRCVALSALLTTVARRAVDFSPMHTFDSPTAGTGKSLITDIISVVATGDRAAVLAMTEDPQEFDKLLSAYLMRGRALVAIDNCNVPLKSTVLNQMLSQPMTELRILGKSELVLVRSNSITIANGNNLIIHGDLTRRTICGRMDAGVERPELLRFDYSPLDDAAANRAELVVAALTVLRAYHLTGRPNREPLGGFEQWSYLIRGALVWLGEDDPVDTMEKLRENDPQLSNLRAIMFEWARIWKPGTPVTVNEMVQRAEECVERSRIPVHPEWHNVVMTIAGRGSSINNKVFGEWIRSNQDRPTLFNNTGTEVRVRIKKGKLLHGRQTWTLVKAGQEEDKQGVLL